MKLTRFAFLVTNGEDTDLQPAWGMNWAEAKESLSRSLNTHFSIVENVELIEEYIRQHEALTFPSHKMMDNFHQDFASLKRSIA